MRTHIMLTYILFLIASGVFAQSIETDDMYFTSKDREKLKAKQSQEMTYASAKKSKRTEMVEEEESNPTDSYSARNVNPEYAARSNAKTAQEDNQDYYDNTYQYRTSSDFNNWNNNFNSWYGNAWYNSNFYGPAINQWRSPYYGYYDPFYSPWYDPYWNYNGWSTSFSYHWGNSWNYGWGGNYNYWNRPYYYNSWASNWGPSWGYGSSWYGRPGTIIVINNGEHTGRTVTEGRRPSRSSIMLNRPEGENNSRTRSSYQVPVRGREDSNGSSNTGGRVANRRQDEYYDRSWKYTPPANNNDNNGWNSNENATRYNNQGNDSYNGRSNSSYSPSRSSSSSSGGAVRQHSSSSGSGSNGRTRGRD